ncbi:unnamed protein product, partial [Ixodes persulcatus]
LQAQEACGRRQQEIDSALEMIRELDRELEDLRKAALTSQLRPLPGDNSDLCALKLGATSKVVGSSMAQLLTAASQGNESYTGTAARDTASALKQLTGAVRGVAASSGDSALQTRLVDHAREVLDRSCQLLEEARQAVLRPDDPDKQQRLAHVAKSVSAALNSCVNCLPGQKDVDDTIRSITDSSQATGHLLLCMQALNAREFPSSGRPYGELQAGLTEAAAGLQEATGHVVQSSRGNAAQLASSVRRFGGAFGTLLGCGLEMAGQARDAEARAQMVVSLKNVSMVSSKLLVAAKSVAADPGAPNAKNQLAAAARAVTESINHLVDVCTSAAPGQKECDGAVRAIQMMRPLLDQPNEPVNDLTYFDCLDTVMEKSQSLGDAMTGIANHAKRSEHEQFGESVKEVSSAICGLVESSAQAAYLVGASDASSVAGKPGLVDLAHFARASQAIQMACQQLSNPTSSQPQILSAATVIAKHTSSLCNACRVASSKTMNPVAKRHFVQSAKDVASATASLVKEIKVLDQEPNEVNRQRCGDATRPLVEAVDSLTTFASSPEFAGMPARISHKARAAQEPITSAGRTIIDGSCSLILSAKSLALNPKDPPAWQSLASHSKEVSDGIKRLVSSIRDKAPGQKECEEAIERLNACIRELDQASLNILSQSTMPHADSSLKAYQEQMENSASEILEKIEPLRCAAKGEAEKLGHAVTQMVGYLGPLVQSAVAGATRTVNSKQQMALLDQTKTVAECCLQLVYAAKGAAGNPKVGTLGPGLPREGGTYWRRVLPSPTSATGSRCQGVDSAICFWQLASYAYSLRFYHSSLTFAMTKLELALVDLYLLNPPRIKKNNSNIGRPFIYFFFQEHGKVRAKERNKSLFTALSAKSQGDVKNLIIVRTSGHTSSQIRNNTQYLTDTVRCKMTLRKTQRRKVETGEATKDQIQIREQRRSRREQHASRRKQQAKVTSVVSLSFFLFVFCFRGHLQGRGMEGKVQGHRRRRGLLDRRLQWATRGARSPRLIIAAFLGAHRSRGRPAERAGDVRVMFPRSVQVMVTNVTSLLKTVRAVEDEHARGTRALESTVEAIWQEIRAFDSGDPPMRKATPEDLVRATRPVTLATAKAVAAGNSGRQDDVIVAANMGRKAIFDLLATSKSASCLAETQDLRSRVLGSGRDCAVRYRELLQAVLEVVQRPTSEGKQSLVASSRSIAMSVTDIVAAAEALKGNDWADPDDPTVIAETELLGAASSIEAAARKLANLQPRRSIKEADESLNFDEMILEAAKSITAATSALVRAASAAQRELVAAGKLGERPLYTSDDGQWSEGLVSAARLVAAATHSLVESANWLVQGQASEEKLISSAKQVASSTAQLLVACKVKAEPDSSSMRGLQVAGNAVKQATDHLVRAAQQSIEQEQEFRLVVNRRMVGGIAQEIVAREEILRKERELEEAREKLAQLRRAKYGSQPQDSL